MCEEFKECLDCKKILPIKYFYENKNSKYDYLCKDCRCKKIYDDKPWTVLDSCEYFDIPFIELEWFSMVEKEMYKCVANKKQYTTIFPKYLAKMKLKSWRSFSYKDSKELNYLNNEDYYHNKINEYRKKFFSYDIREYIDIIKEIKNESIRNN